MQPRVVRKVLDDDCLLDGELHPSIRMRLERVRELPVAAVANFYGVQRFDGKAYLVWEYVEGRTLQEVLNDASPQQAAALRRDVELAVHAMHAAGLVHGALHARNVIVDPQGRVRLTHVTPLLYDDPEKDWSALKEIFGEGEKKDQDRALKRRAWPSDEEGIAARSIIGAVALSALGVAFVVAMIWYVSNIS